MKRIAIKLSSLDFLYILGLFIFIIYVYALSINSILPLFKIAHPLSSKYLSPLYLLFIILLLKIIFSLIHWLFASTTNIVIKLLLLFNPILVIVGTFYLNNSGNEIIITICLLISCLTFVLTLISSKSDGKTFSIGLFSISTVLLLSNSLRSNFLVGYDIHQEFLVFKLTNIQQVWNISSFKDAYNACLSITILPTVISQLFHINDLLIFKFIFPLLISSLPSIVYLIGSRFIDKKTSYIGGFIFLLQAQFFTQLPAVQRQGIAFIFFALIVDVLVNTSQQKTVRKLLYIVFSISLILSHYSTTYITLALLSFSKLFYFPINKFLKIKNSDNVLTTGILILLFAMTFLWNTLITDTTGGIKNIFSQVAQNIEQTFSLESKADTIKEIFYTQSNNNVAVSQYTRDLNNDSKVAFENKNYKIYPVNFDNGKILNTKDPIILYFHFLIPWIFRFSIFFGFLYIIFKKNYYSNTPLVLSMSISSFISILFLIILPYLSFNYNFERLFQQTLVILAPITVLGFYSANIFKRKGLINVFVIIISLSYYLQTTGIIDHYFYSKTIWSFDNTGEQYYRSYTILNEIEGIKWLENNSSKNPTLFADRYSKLRFMAYSSKKYSYISTEINPQRIIPGSYIFSGLAGSVHGVVFSEYKNQIIRYSYPNIFLEENKNLIYSNSKTKIYR